VPHQSLWLSGKIWLQSRVSTISNYKIDRYESNLSYWCGLYCTPPLKVNKIMQTKYMSFFDSLLYSCPINL